MKFSAKTIQILRNFSTINQSIMFVPGRKLKTISPVSSIMAQAEIDVDVEEQFAIYNLAQFLGAISLFENPELTASKEEVIITNGSETIRYACAEPALIKVPPQKEIVLPSKDVFFSLKNDVLAKMQKALGIINAPEIAVSGDRNNIYLEALNTKDSSQSTYKVAVGHTDKSFRLIFRAENIKLLAGDYDVTMSSKGLAHFNGEGVEYWIVVEANSTFEG